MTADPISLENLFDLVMPSPVPWWPPAPGWFVVSGVVLVLAVWTAWHAWKRWRAAAYRRAALAEWQQLRTQAANPGLREVTLRHLPELVKRTAIAAFPRAEVASLSSMEWLRFLDRTGHTDAFTRGRGQLLAELAYDPRAIVRIDTTAVEELFSVVRRWIGRHSVSAEAAIGRS
jgi:hypothetical protein